MNSGEKVAEDGQARRDADAPERKVLCKGAVVRKAIDDSPNSSSNCEMAEVLVGGAFSRRAKCYVRTFAFSRARSNGSTSPATSDSRTTCSEYRREAQPTRKSP